MNNTQTSSRFGVVAKGASIVLSAALLASSFSFLGSTFAAPEVDAASSVDYMVDNQQDGSILQCFNWSFTAIKNNMSKIADQGFTAVQTSPIQTAKEATAGKTAKGSWWVQYQPADFTIETNANGTGALGTASEFRAMCDEAHKYGVRVIVDAVLNHMANKSKNDLSPAIPEKYRNNSNFWHDISKNSWYESRYDITQFCMDGVPDLNTGSSDVQNAAISFLKECIDCGADGFRFDGAKHIEVPVDSGFGSQFWPNVLGTTTSYAQSTRGITPYYYGEVLDKPTGDSDISNGQNVANSYAQYMSITMSGVSNSIRGSVNSGDANGAKRSDYSFDGGAGSVSGAKAVLWNESHDTYQAGSSIGVSDYKMNQTWALVGTRATSCGMYLARPSNWGSAMMGQGDVTAWANTEVKAVNNFNNYFVGETEYLSASNGVVYNERGTAGVVLVNVSGGATSVSVAAHKIANGTYKDQITGNDFTVSNGMISGNIGSTGIAVVYNAVPPTHSAIVSASPAGGSFTDTVTATLSVKNADSGNYSTSDGQSGTYTNGKTITFGSGVAVGGTVTLTLSATGEDGVQKTETYTFTKKDPSAVTTIYFDNSTYNWSNVYTYVYLPSDDPGPTPPTPSGQILFSDTKGWGTVYAYFFANNAAVGAGWPGTVMSSNGTNEYGQAQYKIDVPSGATGVVFNNNNGSQSVDGTVAANTGYYCKDSTDSQGHYELGTWTITSSSADTAISNAAWPGVKMTMDASTGYYMYEVPDNLVNGYAIFSDGTDTASKRYPADGEAGLAIENTSKLFAANYSWTDYVPPTPPTKDPTVKCNKTSGSSFNTETLDITLSLENATSGTYSVDGGPTKTFTSAATVAIGEGKIGDSTVTVAATATNSEGTTKNYTFTFNKKYVVKTTSSSAASTCDKYATNPGGNVGANKTITKASDFTPETLIAQGIANDDPAIFRGSHEAPKFDPYALYAAWDNTNLYVGIQYTNVIDVVDPAQQAPQTGRGKPNGADADIPQMLLFDLGTGDYTDGSTNSTSQSTVWNTHITFGGSTKVDKVIMYSPKEGIDNYSVFPVTNGVIDYVNAVSPGYQKPLAGASITWEDGFFCSNMYGISACGYGGYKPADIESSSSNWVDFLTTSHSTTHDTFCIITMPLSYLGVSASDIANNGIGLMAVSTYGSSGIGCLPHDTCMLDNATEPYEQDDSTSGEKSDDDQITVPLARVGKGGGVVPPTPSTVLQANFGTDKSAPQLTTTALTLKAIGMGGTAPYTYTFKVDGTTVKADNSTATYTWTPATAGKHTISCIIKDSTGATDTTTKTFTAEGSDVVVDVTSVSVAPSSLSLAVGGTATLTATVAPSNATDKSITWSSSKTSVAKVSSSGKVTAVAAGTATITATSSNGKTATCKVTVTDNPSDLVNNSYINSTGITLGSRVYFYGAAEGGSGSYKYAFYYKRTTSSSWKLLGTEYGTADNTFMTPTSTGDFDIKISVKDTKNAVADKTFSVTVSDGKSTAFKNNSTINTTGALPGTKIKLTAAASGSSGYKYAFYYKRTTARAWYISGTEFGTATTAQFTPKTEGEFNVKVDIMDKNGDIVSRQFAVSISNDYKATSAVNNATINTNSALPGTKITVTGAASGGTSPYKYAFYYKKAAANNWSTMGTPFGSDTSRSVTLKNKGDYIFKVCVKDATGGMVSKNFDVEITDTPAVSDLSNESKISSNNITAGSKLTMTGAASGGTAPYTYGFYYKKSTASTYSTSGTAFSGDTSRSITLKNAGVYDIMITVKDSTGATVDKTFAVIVS